MSYKNKSMQAYWQDSYLAAGNEEYLENLYEKYLADPNQIDSEWQVYFNRLKQQGEGQDIPHRPIVEQFRRLGQKKVFDSGGGFDSA